MARLAGVMAALVLVQASAAAVPAVAESDFLIIAHRGASADRPEHTLAAYELAIAGGADYIEPDLVATKDLVLVARHENELSGTTDVASRPEFADRRRDKTIDGQQIAGWFAEDFTLAELRTLRARERIPALRPGNARYDGLYQVPTLAEIVQLVRLKEAETGRRIGIYPEIKHPTFMLQTERIDLVDLLLRDLKALGMTPADPVFIQSFDAAPLRRLKQRSDFKLVQLVAPVGGPADEPALRYAEMVSPSGWPRLRNMPMRSARILRWCWAGTERRQRWWPMPRRRGWQCTHGRCGLKTNSCPKPCAPAPIPRGAAAAM
jgi:glycerophosphoryl diester phosphodiesterase